jgi:hypothetical protein
MNSHALKRAGMLVFAIALIMLDALNLCGQQDWEDLTFDTPVTKTESTPAKPVNPAGPVSYPQKRPVVSPAGKAKVTQAIETLNATNPRSQTAGMDPKRLGSTNKSSTVPARPTQPTDSASGSQIKQAGYVESTQGLTRDGLDPLLIQRRPRRNAPAPTIIMTPPDRGSLPPIRGSITGLSGETATERLIQMQNLKVDLERENDELRQLNAALQTRVKENQEQLIAAVKEIQSARRELSSSRTDLDRLRTDIQGLREKIKMAEKEHAGFLQSMGPLLQQLLESTDVSALPTNPPE